MFHKAKKFYLLIAERATNSSVVVVAENQNLERTATTRNAINERNVDELLIKDNKKAAIERRVEGLENSIARIDRAVERRFEGLERSLNHMNRQFEDLEKTINFRLYRIGEAPSRVKIN